MLLSGRLRTSGRLGTLPICVPLRPIPWLVLRPRGIVPPWRFPIPLPVGAGTGVMLRLLRMLTRWYKGVVHKVLPMSTAISATIDIVPVQLVTVEAAPRVLCVPHGSTNTANQLGVPGVMRIQAPKNLAQLKVCQSAQMCAMQVPGPSGFGSLSPSRSTLRRRNCE